MQPNQVSFGNLVSVMMNSSHKYAKINTYHLHEKDHIDKIWDYCRCQTNPE